MQKLMKALAAIMLTVAALAFATGCKPDNGDSDVRVTTYTPQDITRYSAVCGGDVIVTQGLSLSSFGVCWSTERNPTAEDAHLSTTNWSEPYICTISGLEPGTKYHVRAYALRGLEYYYGDDKTFTTVENSGGNGGSGGGNGGGGEESQTYTITTSASPADGGTVTGGGTYDEGVSVTLRAAANTNYTFDHWQDGNTANPRTITVTSNASYTAYFSYNGGGGGGSTGDANGHAYVDLGLPSGTLWATCNVGATTPEGYGNYYAWGETTTKSTYNWSTYRYCNGSSTTLTKYCSSSTYGNNGFTDNLTTLQLSDDAARANWGGDWRMPTKAEWEELKNNTTVTWTTQNGVSGRKFTASNGNSLFLPAAGYRRGGSLFNAGDNGHYWSSSLYTDDPYYAWGLSFDSDPYYMGSYYRYCGLSVRAVLSASKN